MSMKIQKTIKKKIYKTIKKKIKVLADIEANKNFYRRPIVTQLFMKGRKLNIHLFSCHNLISMWLKI